jgi:hypothetical protein
MARNKGFGNNFAGLVASNLKTHRSLSLKYHSEEVQDETMLIIS